MEILKIYGNQVIMEILKYGESVFILKQNPEGSYISQIDNKANIHILIVILSVLWPNNMETSQKSEVWASCDYSAAIRLVNPCVL